MTALEATASTSAVIHSCCLLAPDLLGMTLAIESADQEAVDVRVLADHAATTHELTARWLQCPSDRPGQWLLLTIALPAGTSARDLGGLRVRIGGVTRATTPDSLDRVLSEPRDFGLAHRDAFDPAVRRRMQAFLAGTADQDGVELTPALASTLNQVRDTLRGALPKTKLAPGPCAARLESVTAIDDRG
ncbi:MAG: hypothetical protein QOE18_1262, partial [Chloroflexota bacterium]|nr:hypothetical protein [Chloroflexota bacterium]